jgi:hypothetical protein
MQPKFLEVHHSLDFSITEKYSEFFSVRNQIVQDPIIVIDIWVGEEARSKLIDVGHLRSESIGAPISPGGTRCAVVMSRDSHLCLFVTSRHGVLQ